MKLINKTKNFVISYEIFIAESFISRMKGLMLSDKKDLVLVSPREDIVASCIHMFFMLYPIDVIWLDSTKKVVDLKRRVLPFNPLNPKTWRIYKPRKRAKYVIELGNGDVKNTEIGDSIEFII